MNVKGASDDIPGGNEEHVIGNERKSDTCYKVAKTLFEQCSVGWKVELVSDKIRYLAEITKGSVEGAAWFHLVAYSKIREERNTLKEGLLSRKVPELGDLENFQPIQIMCSGNRVKDVARQLFAKQNKLVTHGSNQPSQQK